jgi:hypothetical protein
MKLTTYAWIMSAVVFVGTLPHAAGAMFQKQVQIMDVTETCKNLSMTSLTEMKKMAKRIGKMEVMKEYKSKREWKSLLELWNRESRWDYTAANPTSSAYGIPQLLKMDESTPMGRQIDLGLKYIKHRYDTPARALAFHNRNGWY